MQLGFNCLETETELVYELDPSEYSLPSIWELLSDEGISILHQHLRDVQPVFTKKILIFVRTSNMIQLASYRS